MITQEFLESLVTSINLDIYDYRVKSKQLDIYLDDYNGFGVEGVVFWDDNAEIDLAASELCFSDEYGDEYTLTESQERFLVDNTKYFTD